MGATSLVVQGLASAESTSRSLLGVDAAVLVAALLVIRYVLRWVLAFSGPFAGTPQVTVAAEDDEKNNVLKGKRLFDYSKEWGKSPKSIPCWDPSTLEYLGEMPAHSAEDVASMVQRARVAQKTWGGSSFDQRRQLLRVLQRCITENAELIAKVSCRESGKTMIDAMVGEITVTLEKLRWTQSQGERYLLPEYRDSGLMNLHKTSRVEWVPVGVVGAIVPWNYPFHNVLNPIVAAIFSGNAIVVKVSEFASWSTKFYGRLIAACLVAVNAPTDLVQITTGYGEAGSALVAKANKIIFVGSVGVGKKVMEAASKTLTPVILELGGKDPFIVCDDTDPKAMAQLVVRGAYQNMGQNCAGPERFIVHEKVYDCFCKEVTAIVQQMKQGPPLISDYFDCGACVHPPSLQNYQRLVDDAVSKGAKVLCGGKANPDFPGQFFLPTVLADVQENMLIAKEETFGPILSIFRVKDDDAAVRLANNCPFALSACAHSGDQRRAARICAQLDSGMVSVNDIEGTTYLSQSLPFGGFKDSGFERFAGPEGLRGLCNARSIVENRAAFLQPSIPRPIAYPANGQGPAFCLALNQILYGHNLAARATGVLNIIKASLPVSAKAQ